MSTRSNIYLKLKQETKGQTLKFNPELIKIGYKTEYPIPDVDVPAAAKYIGIYHHWDGYLSGVGVELLKNYTDYDKILNLLMMGDMSSIIREVSSYRGWRNENTPPTFIESDNLDSREAKQEEYAYLFDGEQWLVTYEKYIEESDTFEYIDWIPLTEALNNEK